MANIRIKTIDKAQLDSKKIWYKTFIFCDIEKIFYLKYLNEGSVIKIKIKKIYINKDK